MVSKNSKGSKSRLEDLTDDQVIGGMLLHFIEMPENFDKIEWLLEKSRINYNALGLLADENVFEKNPAYRLGEDELKEVVSRAKWDVKKFLNNFGIQGPRVRYYDDDKLAHPSNQYILMNAAASVFFGVAGVASNALAAVSYADGDLFACAGTSLLSLFSIACASSRAFKARSHYQNTGSISEVHYSPIDKTVYLSYLRKEHLVPALGHEIAHHLQNANGFHQNLEFVLEGHARGVQRAISDKYAMLHDNPRYLSGIVNMDFSEYKAVYSYLCEKKGIPPIKELLHPISIFDCGEQMAMNRTGLPSTHATGNALFSILELDQGDQIYAKLLKDKIRLEREEY